LHLVAGVLTSTTVKDGQIEESILSRIYKHEGVELSSCARKWQPLATDLGPDQLNSDSGTPQHERPSTRSCILIPISLFSAYFP
jgi:hypothetical protein